MRPIEPNALAALTGSRTGDRLVCWVWYDGRLVHSEPLPVSGWSMSWDGSSRTKIQGSVSITVADPDGNLAPWLLEDPLGVGGSRLQVSYLVSGTYEIRMGWYRINGNDVGQEEFTFRVIREDRYQDADSIIPANHRLLAVPGGASIDVTAQDLTELLDADRFLAPQQPVGPNPTVVSEVTRLVGDTLPVTFSDDFPDRPVPAGSTWEDNRVEAIMDLLDAAGASFRMSGDGELHCYVKDPTPVFRCEGGEDSFKIRMRRGQQVEGIYNVGVVTGTKKALDGDGREIDVPIMGVYELNVGPLKVGGPFGRRVIKNDNPLMMNQLMVDRAAESLVLNALRGRRIELQVECLPMPHIEVGDSGIVTAPLVDGRIVPLVGEVEKIGLSGSGGAVNAMTMTMLCDAADVERTFRTHTITPHLTGDLPAASFGLINPHRTIGDFNELTIKDLRGADDNT